MTLLRMSELLRCVAVLAVLLSFVGCMNRVGLTASADGPPRRLSPVEFKRLQRQPDPVPRDEPLAERGNPAEYVVFGKRYRTLPTAEGYYAEGIASWYGRKFHGRETSSGEPFDMFALTAAHRELPLPTYLLVTNLTNGKQAVVRVNDRGPFHGDRLLDLSYGAAVKLGFSQYGTARVRLQALAGGAVAQAPTTVPDTVAPVPEPLLRDSTATASVEQVAAVMGTTGPSAEVAETEVYFVQAGAFASEAAAEALRRQLQQKLPGGEPVDVQSVDGLFRVRVGPLPTPEAAVMVQWDLRQAALPNALVLAEPSIVCLSAC